MKHRLWIPIAVSVLIGIGLLIGATWVAAQEPAPTAYADTTAITVTSTADPAASFAAQEPAATAYTYTTAITVTSTADPAASFAAQEPAPTAYTHTTAITVTSTADPAASFAAQEPAPTAYTYTTAITVTSTADPDDSKSKTCISDTPCTLRRAIVQARNTASAAAPVLIRFDIPVSDAGYDPMGWWTIDVYATNDLIAFRRLTGHIIIDGETQPGGRTDGPKIVVAGPGTGQKTGFIVGDTAGDDGITIRGLAMQNFSTHIIVNHDDNLIEDCWFGLSASGDALTSGDISDPEGGSAIALSATADRATIRDNAFAGFFGAAVAIRGSDATFAGNTLGMRADGTVPLPAQMNRHPCSGSSVWAGGSGITVEGDGHTIGGPAPADGNRFAGLYLDLSPTSEQPFAIQFTGGPDDVTVQQNVIGLDGAGDPVGICGRGIKLSGGPENTRVISNTIVETGLSAVLMNGGTLNGNMLQGNLIKRTGAWPGAQGFNTFAEDAIAYGGDVPAALRAFKPGAVTQVDGVAVSGAGGSTLNDQPCAYCTIELFLDDADGITEALQSLVTVTADATGAWSATLPAPLGPDEGVRTMSTVTGSFTLDGLEAGTTSNLSRLYRPPYAVFLPFVTKE